MRPSNCFRVFQKSLRTLLAAAALLGLAQSASAALLAQYNPSGFTLSFDPLAASNTLSGITASSLTETGLGGFSNTDVLPVGTIGAGSQIDPFQYLSFTVGSSTSAAIVFTDLQYSKVSYFDRGAQHASLRSSLDGFASDVSVISVNPFAGAEELLFDLSSLAPTVGPVTFQLYFYDGLDGGGDFADLGGTGSGGNGLRINGDFLAGSVPEPHSLALLGLALCILGGTARGRRPPYGLMQ